MDKPLEINLHAILRKRLSRGMNRMLPGFVISGMERLIRQNELNEILRVTFPYRGSEFSAKVLEYLEISVEVRGLDDLPTDRRYMFASNHPLGGLDGIALVAVLGAKYGDENLRVLVNDMLMNVEPLKDVFLPINKFGAQGRSAARQINEALASDKQILQFPAGLVSRKQKGGVIEDLEWQKAFVAKAIEYKREIVPVRFIALNSSRFYNIAQWRKRLGIKFNFEQILLPAEVCRSREKKFRIIFGEPIPYETLAEDPRSPKEIAEEIRSAVYKM